MKIASLLNKRNPKNANVQKFKKAQIKVWQTVYEVSKKEEHLKSKFKTCQPRRKNTEEEGTFQESA